MKIGILTFHASHNYGSMLQAYALQTYLQGEGHKVKIINHRIAAQKQFYSNPLFTFTKGNLRYLLHPVLFCQNVSKWYKFENFMRKYYNLTSECPKLIDVEATIYAEKFDAIITGGDQIWNMNARDFSIAYFLPFDKTNYKRIAYSPSFGSGERFAPAKYSQFIKALLNRYDYLSVRDEEGSALASKLLGRDVPSMTDPTILLNKKVYDEMAGDKPLIKGKYIFYYSPVFNKEYDRFAFRLAMQTDMPIFTSKGKPNQSVGMKRIQNVGPIEFLNLLKFADVVVGKSFHLIVFSLLLHKQFVAITGDTDARIKGLLKRIGLQDHAFSVGSNIDIKQLQEVDWNKVDQVLLQLKECGATFLTKSLKL